MLSTTDNSGTAAISLIGNAFAQSVLGTQAGALVGSIRPRGDRCHVAIARGHACS